MHIPSKIRIDAIHTSKLGFDKHLSPFLSWHPEVMDTGRIQEQPLAIDQETLPIVCDLGTPLRSVDRIHRTLSSPRNRLFIPTTH
jgi:hypothetical protein